MKKKRNWLKRFRWFTRPPVGSNEPTKCVTLLGWGSCAGSQEDWQNCQCTREGGGCRARVSDIDDQGV